MALAPLKTRRTLFAIKEEAVEGVPETLTAVNAAYEPYEAAIEPDIAMNQRNTLKASLGKLPSIPGAKSATATIKVDFKGSGVEGTAPVMGLLLKACGMAETIVPATSVEYAPASSGEKSYTIWVLKDGTVKKMYGARGTFSLEAENGGLPMLTFTFTGVWGEFDDLALFTGIVYEDTDPSAFLGTLIEFDGSPSPCVAGMTLDYGNVVSLRECSGESKGYISALISDRNPTGSLSPELAKKADFDFFGKWESGTLIDINLVIGDTAGAGLRFEISIPYAQISGLPEGDRNGIATLEMAFEAKEGAGDDEVVITQTQ